MRPLLIFPFNGNALEAVDCLDENFNLKGFVDDTPEKQDKSWAGAKVFNRDILKTDKESFILAVPGSPLSYNKRDEIIGSLGIPDDRFATVIHPSASVSRFATIGKNVLIMAGVVITSNVIIGDHVCILPNTVIHHDVKIGDYTLIGSNVTIAGGTDVGRKCYIGSGSSLISNINIGDGTLIGISSNVIRSVLESQVVAGNPAKKIK